MNNIINIFNFSDLRKDRWLASSGQLPKNKILELRLRQSVYLVYRVFRALFLLPVFFIRYIVILIQVSDEFERLHYAPLRKLHKGKDCVIDKQTWLINGQNIYLGDFVKISAFSSIMAGYESDIKIGTNSIIGPGVVIVSFNHGTIMNGIPIRYQVWEDLIENSIRIGDDVWIGANVIILPGTTIGSGSIIGAGTVLRGNIPEQSVAFMKDGRVIVNRRK